MSWDGATTREPQTTILLERIAAQARIPLLGAHELQLIHRGDDHFAVLEQRFATARHQICVEIYQLRRDAVGTALCRALLRAAARGVGVRLLVDPFGSAEAGRWLDELRQAGLDCRWYRPWSLQRSPFRRSHRKLVIIDGDLANVGGMNWTDRFSERHSGGWCWRDVSLWLRGPAASLLAAQFEAAWDGVDRPELPTIHESTSTPLEARCAVAGGGDGRHQHAATYHALAAKARNELLIATPYFFPESRFRRLLCATAQRGVRVVVVVPRHCDLFWFKHAGRTIYPELLHSGVEIWERTDRMVHAKVAVVDRCVAALGSVNLNRLSFHSNSETLLVTSQRQVVNQLTAMIAREAAQHSDVVERRIWRRHPDRRRLMEVAALAVGLVL